MDLSSLGSAAPPPPKPPPAPAAPAALPLLYSLSHPASLSSAQAIEHRLLRIPIV